MPGLSRPSAASRSLVASRVAKHGHLGVIYGCPLRCTAEAPVERGACRATGTPMDAACSCSRDSTHYLASSSSPPSGQRLRPLRASATVEPQSLRRTSRGRSVVVSRALFDPPPFTPEKLTASFMFDLKDTQASAAPPASPRCYTLTHNDLTGQLTLTVGGEYNMAQISGFYTRLLRDEIRAEWRHVTGVAGAVVPGTWAPASRSSGRGKHTSVGVGASLHIFCHVSGEERWLASPALRNYIFRRELPLVLDTILYADRHLLAQHPHLRRAEVIVHFQSNLQELNSVERWGVLGERSSWQKVPTSILQRVLQAVVGWPGEPAAHGILATFASSTSAANGTNTSSSSDSSNSSNSIDDTGSSNGSAAHDNVSNSTNHSGPSSTVASLARNTVGGIAPLAAAAAAAAALELSRGGPLAGDDDRGSVLETTQLLPQQQRHPNYSNGVQQGGTASCSNQDSAPSSVLQARELYGAAVATGRRSAGQDTGPRGGSPQVLPVYKQVLVPTANRQGRQRTPGAAGRRGPG